MHTAITSRWSELSPLLDQVLELAPGLRDPWIEREIADADLRDALSQLLAAYTRADGPLADHATGVLAGFADEGEDGCSTADQIGRMLGSYRLLRLIGSGGMASVFLAERCDGAFTRQVAVKLLRHGLHDPYEQQRFLRERVILARLQHPHIARLLDGGLTGEGVPWFALEYVAGEPITRWCDARSTDIGRRLALFLDVCAAVEYAQNNLIVHRDLKPSNVLVDDAGTVKLLDFGIAKLLDAEAGQTEATATAQRRLTPAYAAPEQWQGGAITAATDVYALGVLLHELLTGRRPELRENDTTRLPSALVSGPAATAAARARASSPATLRRRLSGDLDLIVLKALRQEPEQRYPSAGAFAADLRRHLDGMPITARPPTRGYRLRKFAARHRGGMAAAAVIVLALIAGMTATLHEARQARDAAVEARSQAAKAEAAAAQAQNERERALSEREFLVDLFGQTTPGGNLVKASVEDLLRIAPAQAEHIFATQPSALLDTLLSLCDAQLLHGETDIAKATLARAQALAKSSVRPTSAQQLVLTVEAAHVAEASGAFGSSKADLQAALARYRAAGGGDSQAAADALAALAENQWFASDIAGAVASIRAARAMRGRLGSGTLGGAHSSTYLLMEGLLRLGQPVQAEAVARADIPVLAGMGPPWSDDVGVLLDTQARAEAAQGKLGQAEATLRRGLAIDAATLSHTMHGAATGGVLCEVLLAEGRIGAARDVAQKMIRSEPDAKGRRALANQQVLGRAELALSHATAAERIFARIVTEDIRHPSVHRFFATANQRYLALADLMLGRDAEAETLLDAALAADTRTPGGDADSAAEDRLALTRLALKRGRTAQAVTLARSADAVLNAPGRPTIAAGLRAALWTARALLADGQTAAAVARTDAALAVADHVVPLDPALRAGLEAVRGRAALAAGRDADARAALAAAQQTLAAIPAADRGGAAAAVRTWLTGTETPGRAPAPLAKTR